MLIILPFPREVRKSATESETTQNQAIFRLTDALTYSFADFLTEINGILIGGPIFLPAL
jgi:hypothetical protein